ncbi:hypothetical protein JHK87_054538 [Glycine soja]|nr:hypothetical protein JHK87_054538 [Glycine soja]
MSRVIDDDSKPAKRKRYNSEMKEGLTSDDIFAAQPNYKKGKDLLHHRKNCKGEEEKQNDSMSRHRGEDYISQPDRTAVGTFVRAKVDSNDYRQRKSYHLTRVLVSFMYKAVPISELSDEDFTEQECEDLQQKVKASLLPKLSVVEVQEKAEILHEDITKQVWIPDSMLIFVPLLDRTFIFVPLQDETLTFP